MTRPSLPSHWYYGIIEHSLVQSLCPVVGRAPPALAYQDCCETGRRGQSMNPRLRQEYYGRIRRSLLEPLVRDEWIGGSPNTQTLHDLCLACT